MTECDDFLTHATCEHPLWIEVQPSAALQAQINAARDAATLASRLLTLDLIRIRFFGPGPLPRDGGSALIATDVDIRRLNAGAFDATMLGKACQPETTPLPTVWVRVGLSAALTAAIVLHEARHVWQDVTNAALDAEMDATAFMWRHLKALGYSDGSIADALREAGY
jgi:hypothetical protein